LLKPVACMQRHGEIEGCEGECQATDLQRGELAGCLDVSAVRIDRGIWERRQVNIRSRL
jgi:hypothetical protein